MKRALAVLLSAAAAVAAFAAGAGAPPKVAVLDTVVPASFDQSIVVPTTEKIIERLVVSGRFTVLDRTNIESVLKEREFQLTGMVSDEEVVKAGKYLGADYVVVAKVQKVSDTYFISAKMIEIQTGVISAQASADSEGKLSVLIGLSAQVGDQLAGGAAKAQPKAAQAKQKPAKAERPDEGKGLRPRLLVSVGANSSTITFTEDLYQEGTGAAFDCSLLVPVLGGLSVVASLDGVYFETSSYPLLWENTYVDLAAGVGYALPLGSLVLFADLKGGYTHGIEAGSFDWEGDGTCFGLDLGVDWNIGRFLVIGTKYQYVLSTIDVEGTDGTEVGMSSFFVSAGIRF